MCATGPQAVARLEPGFQFKVSSFRFQFALAALASQLIVPGFRPGSGAIDRVQPRFWSLGPDSGLDLLRLLLNSWSPVSGRDLVRLSGYSPDSGLQFQILVWICSARFSSYGR